MIISDMPDLKKAIRALEVCTSGVQSDLDCTDCPYHDDCESHPMRPMMEMLKDALALLKGQEPRLLTLEEIEQAPDYTLIYEEVRMDWRACKVDDLMEDRVEYQIAPVEKRGGTLYGSGMDTNICPEMFGGPEDECQVRYWSGRPSEELREATPWE